MNLAEIHRITAALGRLANEEAADPIEDIDEGPLGAVEREINRAIAAHNGVHFKTVGDGIQAAFPTAPEAVAAALEAQQTLLAENWGATLVKLRP